MYPAEKWKFGNNNMTTIKLEGNQEPVTEIQTYLESFNKEIEVGHDQQLQNIQLQQVDGLEGEDGGTYFVDQSGQYYYQASSQDAPVLTQVKTYAKLRINHKFV